VRMLDLLGAHCLWWHAGGTQQGHGWVAQGVLVARLARGRLRGGLSGVRHLWTGVSGSDSCPCGLPRHPCIVRCDQPG
jgi:hypothetical protein